MEMDCDSKKLKHPIVIRDDLNDLPTDLNMQLLTEGYLRLFAKLCPASLQMKK